MMASSLRNQMASSLGNQMASSLGNQMANSLRNRMASSLPNRMASLLPNRMASSLPNRMASSLPNRMARSLPKRMACSLPNRMACSLPNRMAISLPNQMAISLPNQMASSLPNKMTGSLPNQMASSYTSMQMTSWCPIRMASSLSNASSPSKNVTEEGKSTKLLRIRPIFLDNQSTTQVDPRVLDKMLPLYTEMFGNPHSRSHSYGWEADDLAEEARKEVADLVHCQPKSIIFTSGATEANNMAIKGLAMQHRESNGTKNHIITTQIEHKCVLQSCRYLQNNGWEVTYLPVNSDGLVDMAELESAIKPSTLLCSIMMVNNEIGVLQDVGEIGRICKERGVTFHTDAAQALGKIPIDVDSMNIGLMSLSGHKVYGPKGVGALYVRTKPRVRLSPIIDGGGQERGFRSGTLPAPLVVGFGEACRVASLEMENDKRHIENLYNRLCSRMTEKLPFVTLNGSPIKRFFGNLNLSFAYVEGESLLMSISQIALSSGSACTSASLEPSYVLRALGVDEELAHTSIRFGIGRFTTEKDVDTCADAVIREVNRLREMSPLYEMAIEEAQSGKKRTLVWT